ncbi:hydroxymethylglutaryl-CoA synthase [Plantibacter flavus]|uniref:Hydroxymethylglutaryl-CoA synthase n=1 Tax=Plantibacter flavus TaxID=150123 RepID=A0A3N2C4W3_9MICO|nr:hydroxymethylglutaryl-CoA synthase [Plantibacter flavus]ROR82460.1 hydroxymethylglutaryl-CoA synthase [Plantibacter flavus]SMG44425.1 hydroxymethylglutaryl-CoA synthase [Plantibacter flavus]
MNTYQTSSPAVGIDDIAFATGANRIDLAELAGRFGVEPAKYYVGLGQSEMSVPAADEDIVTMAAAAAAPIIERHGSGRLRTVLFATESGIDQSKSAGVYVHRLLGLPQAVRVVELKQACYSATAALQFAAALVARNPEETVLVIASDVARYELHSNAEPTQGAGAVAMLVAADPAILELETATGVYTQDVMDFWRPNHSATAIVDGKLSISAYQDAIEGAWADYRSRGGADFSEVDHFCYHQPFTKMAIKAHRHLAKSLGSERTQEELDAQIEPTTGYNRRIGNSYTASVYLALLALLDGDEDLTGRRIAFLSYGSGAVAECFSGIVRPGYRSALRSDANRAQLDARTVVDDARYLQLLEDAASADVHDSDRPRETGAPFRFAGVVGDRRQYEPTSA